MDFCKQALKKINDRLTRTERGKFFTALTKTVETRYDPNCGKRLINEAYEQVKDVLYFIGRGARLSF